MKMFTRKKLIKAVLAASLFAVGDFALAYQPGGISWKITDWANSEGEIKLGDTPGGEAQLYVDLQFYQEKAEPRERPLLVLVPNCGQDPEIEGRPILNLEALLSKKEQSPVYDKEWVNPGPRWRVCPRVDALIIHDQTANMILPLDVDFLRLEEGGISPRIDVNVYEITDEEWKLQLSAEELARKYRNQAPNARVPISADFQVSKGLFKLSDYAATYGVAIKPFNPRGRFPAGVPRSIDYEQVAKIAPVNIESFRSNLKIPRSTRFNKGFDISEAARLAASRGSALDGEKICYPENSPVIRDTAFTPKGLASHTLSGRFSTEWTADHSLHPAFGFLVEAWRVSPATKLGTAWVQADGNWQINVPTSLGFTGGPIRINYLSYNNYYAPQNKDGNRYWWSDTWTVTGSSFSTGHRFIDTDGGTYNGLGELASNAMTTWSRLFWDGGIDPVAASPIKFFFPNTWYDCGDGSNSPWSCATFAGDQIWLIASHGVQGDVVTHEMGHALQAKFWGGKAAAGSGGSHSLSGCYPTRLGLTLGEGFANYLAAWVGYPERNQAQGSFSSGIWGLSFEPEQRTAPPNCANGWENETWVARTFWDLHDTHGDGDDVLWFNHKGAVISLFLSNAVANNGDARDMRFYRDIYRNAASVGHQSLISDIFDQNRQ